MQIRCPKDVLLEKLQLVLKTVTTKSVMPVLAGIRIKTTGSGNVELASTDMELSLRLTVAAQVEGEGASVVPARLLTDVVRSLPAGEVVMDINPDEQMAEVRAGTASFRINCLPAADFPRLPEMPGDDSFELQAAPLTQTIATVARAASRDETRPVLMGVLVSFNRENIRMVATDSYRLSIMETKVESTIAEKKEAIVPRASLEELARLCQATSAEKVTVGISEGQIVFSSDSVILSSRLIEGQFPNYQQLLPEEFKYEIAIDREELLEVISRIGLMAQKNAPLRMSFASGELTVSAQTPQVGEARETMPVAFQGEETEVGFNPEFLKDGIDSIGEEQVVFRIISPLRPGLIKGADDNFLYLVMPVRLNG